MAPATSQADPAATPRRFYGVADLYLDGQPVVLSELHGHEFTRLAEIARSDRARVTDAAGLPVFPRRGPWHAHAAHYPDVSYPAETTGESDAHRRWKTAVCEIVSAIPGWSAQLEVPFGRRRCDVLAISHATGQRVAIEVQRSNQTRDQFVRRSQDYRRESILPVWIVLPDTSPDTVGDGACTLAANIDADPSDDVPVRLRRLLGTSVFQARLGVAVVERTCRVCHTMAMVAEPVAVIPGVAGDPVVIHCTSADGVLDEFVARCSEVIPGGCGVVAPQPCCAAPAWEQVSVRRWWTDALVASAGGSYIADHPVHGCARPALAGGASHATPLAYKRPRWGG